MARLLTLCLLVLGLAACGDDEDPAPAPAAGTATPTAAAGDCKVTDHPEEGAEHTETPLTPADYRVNPPTSGAHHPDWYDDAVYGPGETPELSKIVHAQEHGRVVIQYKPGTPPDQVAKLEALVEELEGYHLLLIENATQMPFALAATTWNRLLGCSAIDDAAVAAVRDFHRANVDKAPEKVP